MKSEHFCRCNKRQPLYHKRRAQGAEPRGTAVSPSPISNNTETATSHMRHTAQGFTLIEVMVVVIILGILAAIIAPRLIGRTDDARVTQARIQIKNFETSLKLFRMDNGFYPSTDQGLRALVNKPTTGRIPDNYRERGYLEKKAIVADPWGNEYIYISPGTEGDYDIICYGADGEAGGEGYAKDITNWDL